MTDEELKALVAENSLAIRQGREEQKRLSEESRAAREKSEQRWEEFRQEMRSARQESERLGQESERLGQESERLWQELLVSRRETDRLITSFNRELGRLGNRLGDYTESLFRPSLERALREQFGMTTVTYRLSSQRNGETLEIDMVGHAGGQRNEVYLVEIKSRLRQDAIDQILDHLRRFPLFFSEHRGKKLFGILAALDVPSDRRTQVLKEGTYLATIRNDVFEIVPPDDFVPRAFGLREA